MKSRHIKHKQVATQDLSNGSAQHQAAASCFINAKANNPLPRPHIKCVSPKTFSQKLYQDNPFEIAEQFEQALEANSLEKIKILLDKLARVGN